MSSDRLALVVALGVATYFATQDPEPRGPVTTLAPITAPAKSPLGPPPVPVPAPPVAVLPPPPQAPLSAIISLNTTVEQLTRRLGDLASEVEQLNQWRAGQEAALLRKASRPVARSGPDEGRLETAAGSPPVRKPKKKAKPPVDLPLEMRTDEAAAKPEAGDVLGIGSVTDSLLKRIDRIEE